MCLQIAYQELIRLDVEVDNAIKNKNAYRAGELLCGMQALFIFRPFSYIAEYVIDYKNFPLRSVAKIATRNGLDHDADNAVMMIEMYKSVAGGGLVALTEYTANDHIMKIRNQWDACK